MRIFVPKIGKTGLMLPQQDFLLALSNVIERERLSSASGLTHSDNT